MGISSPTINRHLLAVILAGSSLLGISISGSGKSTSLTAFIRRIHKPERRIMTVEDPVEYEVAGINQTQVNSEIGFTFASALREILRQDPDVIMVEKSEIVKLQILRFGHP